MYTLRIIEETRDSKETRFDKVVENYSLGNYYSVLSNGATKEFDEVMKTDFPAEDKSTIRAIVIGENRLTMHIEENTENKHFSYFIMTENGKTFEKL